MPYRVGGLQGSCRWKVSRRKGEGGGKARRVRLTRAGYGVTAFLRGLPLNKGTVASESVKDSRDGTAMASQFVELLIMAVFGGRNVIEVTEHANERHGWDDKKRRWLSA